MRNLAVTLPQEIAQPIQRFARHKALIHTAGLLSAAILAALVLFLCAILVDRLVELPRACKPILPLLAVAIPALTALWGVAAMLRAQDADSAAGELDGASVALFGKGGRDAVRSALNFSARTHQDPASVNPYMLAETLREAKALSGKVLPSAILGWGAGPRRILIAVLLGGVILGLSRWQFMQMDLLWQRFLDPLGNYPRPSLTQIEIDVPLDQTMIQGDDMPLKVLLSGNVPAEPRCTLHIAGNGAAELAVVMSPRPQQRFESQIKSVDRSLTFYVTAGDGRSALYKLRVEPRPAITKLSVRYEYPRYTFIQPHEEQIAYRELSAVEGTRATVKFESSLPVVDPQAIFPERKYKAAWDAAQRQGTFRFTIDHETNFTIRLVTPTGADNHGDAGYRVRLVPDNPPTISLLGISENAALYRDDLLQLHYKGTDDFGIAEAFLRCRGADSKPKEYSLQLQHPNQKLAEGDATIDLRELTAEDDSQLDIELVMVDTKGQEAITPRAHIAIVSDTPDRQLEELAKFEDDYLKNYLRPAATVLTAQTARLGILIDGLDAGTPIAGKRKEMLDALCKELDRVRLPQANKILFLTEYPYQSVRAAYYGLSMVRTIPEGSFYVARINAVATTDKARDGLLELKPFLDEQAKKTDAFAEGLSDALLEIRLRLIEQLTAKLVEKGGSEAGLPSLKIDKSDGDGKTAQQREERLAKILALSDLIAKEAETLELAPAFKDLKAAAALGGDARATAVHTALEQLRRALHSGTALDGHLGARMEECRAKYPLPAQMRTAAAKGIQPHLTSALADFARCSRTSYIPNDAELLLQVRAIETLFGGDPQQIAATATAIERLEPWSRRYGIVERLRLLRIAVREFQIDSAVGRLQPASPRFDQRWQEIREMLLSLLCDNQAGMFAALGAEVQTSLRELAQFRNTFLPWSGAAALKGIDSNAVFGKLRAQLGKTLALLEPGVLKESEAALPEIALLWRDVAQNIQKENVRLDVEMPLVTAEMAEAEKRPEAERESKDFKMRTASTPRASGSSTAGFGHDFAERFACHAIAISKGLDIRERLWMNKPSSQQNEAALKQLEAAMILNEYLSYLDENVYDNASAPHINRAWGGLRSGPYPKYLESILKYYDEFKPKARALGNWMAELTDGKADALLNSEEFSMLPAKINRAERFAVAKKAINEQSRFDADTRAAATSDARRPMILALLAGDNSTVYWDRMVLATSALSTAAGRSLQAPAETWAGVVAQDASDCNAAAARIRWLLPEAKALPEELKLLPDLLDEWRAMISKVAADKVGTLSADARAQAREGLLDWYGRLLGVQRGMEVRTFVAPPKPKVRPRYQSGIRNDMFETLGRVVRGETAWVWRVAAEERRVWSQRAQFLADENGPADAAQGGGLDEVAWIAAFEQATRRKSAAAFSRRSQALGLEEERIDERFLKMPRYLYEELLRASKRPYPSQFKEPGLEYIQGLLKSSR